MEKGYRDYGHDIDNTDSVLEAGLGFAVDLKKPGGFLGKDAVLAKKAAGPLTRRIVQVLVKDPEPMLFHAEVVRRDGKPVGLRARGVVRLHASAGPWGSRWSRRASRSTQAYLDAGRWEVEIAGKTYPAVASLKPLYDPESKKIKA